MMRSFLYDLRFALRTLSKNPVFTVIALLSLGIGIGANTAIFTIMDRVILRALPVHDPNRLVLLSSPGPLSGFVQTNYGSEVSFSWPKYQQLRDATGDTFDALIARFPCQVNVVSQSQTEPGRAELVSGNYFEALGIRAALGRLIDSGDTRAVGGNTVAVLSHGYWIRRFGGSPAVLNQTITVNGHTLTIVGVTQAGFQSVGAGEAPLLFAPITIRPQMTPLWNEFDNPHAYWLNIFGRLKPGVSREQAEAGAAVVWHRILESDLKLLANAGPDYRAKYPNKKLLLIPAAAGISSIRDDFSTPLYLLMGMVGLLLLIACANVANLLLARAAGREKEIAIRVSLGASRGRLIRHLLTESALLSLGGGVIGLLIASWAGSLMLGLAPADIPVAGIAADPDGRVLGFAFAISLVTGLLFGSVPALRATRPDVGPVLKEQASSLSSGGHARFRKALVVGQIALSVLLLASAGLFAHSLFNLNALNPGFRSDHVMTFAIDPLLSGYTPERALRLLNDLNRALPSVPGVSGASSAENPLLANAVDLGSFEIEGFQAPDGKRVTLHRNRIGPIFFNVMGIPLIAGREFRESDSGSGPRVAVVNESLAKKYFEGRDPIGRHVTVAGHGKKPVRMEIVGVVKDSKYDDLRETPKPFLYLAAAQAENPGAMAFYVRSTIAAESLAPVLRRVVRQFDPNLPVTGPKPLRSQIMESVFPDRMVAGLACVFAALATLLAAMGLYGVISWAVTRRRREIGIRMALGAHSGEVMRMIIVEVFWLAAIGVGIAAPLWIAAGRVFESQLYGVNARDPLTLAGSIAILSLVAAAAGFIPAFRAAHVDPSTAIRYE